MVDDKASKRDIILTSQVNDCENCCLLLLRYHLQWIFARIESQRVQRLNRILNSLVRVC